MAGKGHQDAFVRPRLNARYRFSKRTLAGTRGNGRGAPIPAIRGIEIERQGSTQDRGRDAHRWTPPARTRTSPIRASGSYLGCLTAKR